jgi:hypothetical protein
LPAAVPDKALTSVASHAAASGLAQSGMMFVLVDAARSNDFVVNPHGSANTSGLPPSPTRISSLVPEITVGCAIELSPLRWD